MRRTALAAVPAVLLAACVTPIAERRADEWRAILAGEAPVGAPADAVERSLPRRGIPAARATHVTVGGAGVSRPHRPETEAAISGREGAGHVGLNGNVMEITACLERA